MGENLSEFRGFSPICESFLHENDLNVSGRYFAQYIPIQVTTRPIYPTLRRLVFANVFSAKVLSLESFPLYGIYSVTKILRKIRTTTLTENYGKLACGGYKCMG